MCFLEKQVVKKKIAHSRGAASEARKGSTQEREIGYASLKSQHPENGVGAVGRYGAIRRTTPPIRKRFQQGEAMEGEPERLR